MMRKCSEGPFWTARRGLIIKPSVEMRQQQNQSTASQTENSFHAIRELGEISSQNIPALQKITVQCSPEQLK